MVRGTNNTSEPDFSPEIIGVVVEVLAATAVSVLTAVNRAVAIAIANFNFQASLLHGVVVVLAQTNLGEFTGVVLEEVGLAGHSALEQSNQERASVCRSRR